MLKLYIANLGKYNEGYLVGDWITLPYTQDELNYLFVKIGLGYYDRLNGGEYVHGLHVGGCVYEEFAIHDVDTDISALYRSIGEYDNLDRLNEVAELLEGLDEHDQKKVESIMEWGTESNFIDAVENMDNYVLYEDINSEEDLGYYWLEESGCCEIPEHLRYYIDYEKFGRDMSINGNGMFTEYGWLEAC